MTKNKFVKDAPDEGEGRFQFQGHLELIERFMQFNWSEF
jgi:hypothetical protein